MKRFLSRATGAVLVAVAFLVLVDCIVAEAAAPWLDKIDADGRQQFEHMVKAIDDWTPDAADAINAEVQAFVKKNPDFVPGKVEATRAGWLRVGDGMGIAHASKSFFVVFEALQKAEPSYAPAYIYGGRAYIFAGYPAGARKQLETALERDPTDPWADLSLSLMYERMADRENALVWAQSALPKTAQEPQAMATAILAITNLQGRGDAESASKLADRIQATQPDAGKLLTVVRLTLDQYGFQPGLLETARELLVRITNEEAPTNAVSLEVAHLDMVMGYMYSIGPRNLYRPEYAAAASDILEKVKDDPALALKAWQYRFQLAIGQDDVEAAAHLLDEATRRGFSQKQTAYQKATLLYMEKKYVELMDLYKDLKLPDDNLLAYSNEIAGDLSISDRIYRSRLEVNPESGAENGNYARFRLFRFNDVDGAIEYGKKAYSLLPSSMNRNGLVIALLVRSAGDIRSGDFTKAKEVFAQARQAGIDRDALRQSCQQFCEAISVPLTTFQ
jgi:tetratricopeptide (TPR) repeat protein